MVKNGGPDLKRARRTSLSTQRASQVLRPTSYGKWVGRPMYLKRGNFSFQARTAQNQLRMGKYGTYLEFNRSQEAPKHCPTFDSLIQCCAIAHFRLPPVCPRFAPSLPPVCPQFDCHCISVTDFFQTVNPYF